MPTLSVHLRRALLAAIVLRAGVALAVPAPPPLPQVTTPVTAANAAPSLPPTLIRRAPDPDPVPWSVPAPIATAFSFKLPLPKARLTRIDTTFAKATVSTGRPTRPRPGDGLSSLRGHGGRGGVSGGGFGGFDGGLGGAGPDIWPAPLHGMPGQTHLRPQDVVYDRPGDLPLPPLPAVPGPAPGSRYGGFRGHGGYRGSGYNKHHIRRHLPLITEWTVWEERPRWRPVTDAYDDFDDDDDVDMGPPPLWLDPTPVVEEAENVTRTEHAKTTFTRTAKVAGTGVKTLKKIWGQVKAGNALGRWGRPGRGGKDKRDGGEDMVAEEDDTAEPTELM